MLLMLMSLLTGIKPATKHASRPLGNGDSPECLGSGNGPKSGTTSGKHNGREWKGEDRESGKRDRVRE